MGKSKVIGLSIIIVVIGIFLLSQTETAIDGVETYPSKPIKLIVAFSEGGGTDIGARLLAKYSEDSLGTSLEVDNVIGNDGEVGFAKLAKSPPDGYTIGFINIPTFLSLPLQRSTDYRMDDVIPIMNYAYDPAILVVSNNSQFKSLGAYIDYANEHPWDITIANTGVGASNHIGATSFEYEAGLQLTHVAFAETVDMLKALRLGYVESTVVKLSEVSTMIRNNELRVLASFTEERLENYPNSPTLKEVGYDIQVGSARAIAVPKGTDQEIINLLKVRLKEIIEDENHIKDAEMAELNIFYMNEEEIKAYMEDQEERLKKIVQLLDL